MIQKSLLDNLLQQENLLISDHPTSLKSLYLEIFDQAYPEVELDVKLDWVVRLNDRSVSCNDFNHSTLIPKLVIADTLESKVCLVKINRPLRFKTSLNNNCCDIKFMLLILANPKDKEDLGLVCQQLRKIFSTKEYFNEMYKSSNVDELWKSLQDSLAKFLANNQIIAQEKSVESAIKTIN